MESFQIKSLQAFSARRWGQNGKWGNKIQLNYNFHPSNRIWEEKKKKIRKVSWNWFYDVVCLVFFLFLCGDAKDVRKMAKQWIINFQSIDLLLLLTTPDLQLEAMKKIFNNFRICCFTDSSIEEKVKKKKLLNNLV